ncbi:adenosylcobinamide-GDP ribazoletransferase [Thalassovita taeanensis]|uniref:Adenosylcobinamide-GDP ribazoletransferase n=1 Tax=Thalassovita taeanensis TaxID=657014 RepID=A0A1H9KK07_9RHOB|nr:adenosylcobinamide-GDP ribazoletransferase [Thalassovita taeanensis]SEQ99432.1 cobalamin-5'-phosphate synthase [Thalassovita taeanensis]
MRENDTSLIRPLDAAVALSLLSRLPLPHLPEAAYARSARAGWAYPLVGAILGAIAGLVGTVALALGMSAPVAALLVLGCFAITSGAMHEDGLADTADGFWGGWDKARRLAIMKDSHIGTYGVIALVLSLLARWWALSLLLDAGGAVWAPLIAVAALSRAGMPALMAALPHARADGLSHSVGRPAAGTAALAFAAALMIGLVCSGTAILTPIILATLAVTGFGWLAKAKIGGQTGDILGASQQIAEIILLLSLTA